MPPVRVLITGSAGQIGYQLCSMVARGDMLGPDQEVILNLLDITEALGSLKGVEMELQDCCFPLLKEVVITDQLPVAFKDVDIALMVGAKPRKEGMERRQLLESNAKIFKEHGIALDTYAKKSVKVLVVGNPANTNAYVMSKYAPSIPKENFSAMTRLDQNRAQAMVAKRLGVGCGDVKNCVIWGNHSNTQFVDISNAFVTSGSKTSLVRDKITDVTWVHKVFAPDVQKRGAAVIAARKLSSAMSAAKAVVDHVHDWVLGTKPGVWVSMSVCSGSDVYGVDKDLFFGYPVTITDGKWSIVKGLKFDEWGDQQFKTTLDELVQERKSAESV